MKGREPPGAALASRFAFRASGVAQAATWNPALEHLFGEAMGQEAYDKGVNVMLGPGMNIARIATNGATSSTSAKTRSWHRASRSRTSPACRTRA